MDLGGAAVHSFRSGVASLVVDDDADALAGLAAILDYLPDHHLDDPPWIPDPDPLDRDCTRRRGGGAERVERCRTTCAT